MPWHYQICWLPNNDKFFRKWLHNCKNSTYKNVYQTNDFSLRILGNKKVFEKTQIGRRQIPVACQFSRNNFLVIVVKIYTEADFKVSWNYPTLLDYFYLLPNIFSRMVGVYYSWEYIANRSGSIKTGIISVASKNGDYVKKHLKISHQKI